MADFTVRGLIEIIIKGGPAADEAKQKLDAMVRSLAAGGPAAAAVTAQFEALARSADSLGVRGKRAGDELRKALASGDVAGTSAAVQKTLDLLDKKRDRVINSAPDTEISRTGAFDPAKHDAPLKKLTDSFLKAGEAKKQFDDTVKAGSAESTTAIEKEAQAAEDLGRVLGKTSGPGKTAGPAAPAAAAGKPTDRAAEHDAAAGDFRAVEEAAERAAATIRKARGEEEEFAGQIKTGSAESTEAIKKTEAATTDLGKAIAKTASAAKAGPASPAGTAAPSTSRAVQDNAAAGTKALEAETKAAGDLEAALDRAMDLDEKAGAVSAEARKAAVELAEAAKGAQGLAGALESAGRSEGLEDLATATKSDADVVKEALGGIRAEVTRLGLDATNEGAKIEKFTADIAKAGGPIQAQTIPAFRDFLKISHDVPATMATVKAAIATSKEEGVSFDSVMKGVVATIRGQTTPAAQGLGIALRNEDGTLKKTEQLLREVAEANVYFSSKAKVARAELDAQEKATHAAGDGFSHLGHTVRDVLGAFGIIVGIREIVGQLKDSVLDFAEVERGINSIGLMIENLGIASREEAPRIREALEAIALDGGAKLKESIPTFQKFVGITQDVNAALYLTQLASNAADTGITTLDGAVEALAGIMQGRAAQGAKTLGIQLRDHNGAVRDSVELLKQAGIQYDNVHVKIDDTKQALDKAAASWHRFWLDMGEGLTVIGAGTINLLSSLEDRLTGVLDKIGAGAFNIYAKVVLGEEDPAGRLAREREQGLGAASPWAREKTEAEPFTPADASQLFPDHSEAVEAGKQFQQAFEDGRARALAAAQVARDREVRKVELESDVEKLGVQIGAEDELSKKRLDLEIQLLEKKRALDLQNSEQTHESESRINARYDIQEQAKREEFDRKVAQAKLRFTEEIRQQTLQREAAAAAEGSQERLAAELAILQSRRTVAVAEAKRLHADVAAVEREYDAQKEATIVRNELKRDEILRRGEEERIKSSLAVVQKGTQEELDLRLRLLDLELADELERVRGNEAEKARIRLQFAMEKANTAIDVTRERVTKERDRASSTEDSESNLRVAQIEAELAKIDAVGGQIEKAKRLQIELINEQAAAEERRLKAKLAGDLLDMESERQKALNAIDADQQRSRDSGVEEDPDKFQDRRDEVNAQQDAETVRRKKQTTTDIETIETKRASAEDTLTKKAASMKREHYAQLASMAISAAQNIFGHSKALAIAAALADTFAAANRALAEGGPYLGPPLAALMVASGLKNVSNIKKTTLGADGGGGDTGGGSGAPGGRPTVGPAVVSFQGAASAPPRGFADGGRVPGPESGRDDSLAVTSDGRAFPIGSGELVNDLALSRRLVSRARADGITRITGPGGFGLTPEFREWMVRDRTPRATGFAFGGRVPGQLHSDEESILAYRLANRIPFERSPLVANLGRGDVESPSEAARARSTVGVSQASIEAVATTLGRQVAIQIERAAPGESVNVTVNMGHVYGGPAGEREWIGKIREGIETYIRTKNLGGSR